MRQPTAYAAGTLRLDELQHEAVLLAAMLHDEPGAIVPGIAQHAGNRLEPETGLLYLVYLEGLVDAMQGGGIARTRAGSGAVVDDAVDPTWLERLEHHRVDPGAVVTAP